jgi:hypothetical protein
MPEKYIGILPFINFKEKTIRLDEFLIVADSKVGESTEFRGATQAMLSGFTQAQKDFLRSVYHSPDNEITFILPVSPTVTKEKLEYLLEILFFYLHKGGATHLLSSPNIFCYEDFKSVILQFPDLENTGQIFIKKRFKFQIVEEVSELRISPSGCENIVAQNQAHGYIYQNIEFDYQSEVIQFLAGSINDDNKRNLLQGIRFYNRAMSCEITDEERFVWLSSSLEAFLRLERQRDKAKAISQGIQNMLQGKSFIVIDKNEAIKSVADLITVTYDYRSSYVHGGKRQTTSTSLESRLKKKFGKLNFVIALMNLTSALLLHDKIPDQKLEGVLNILFYNQSSFEFVVKLYGNSADTALEELRQPKNMVSIYKFLQTGDLPTIDFDRKRVEQCLNNILHIFAKYAREYQNVGLAMQMQQQIDATPLSDAGKFSKWNDFLAQESMITNAPEYMLISVSVFKSLYNLLRLELALY